VWTFYCHIGIVRGAVHGDGEHILVEHGRHLTFLLHMCKRWRLVVIERGSQRAART
jgi:hypothetical protein